MLLVFFTNGASASPNESASKSKRCSLVALLATPTAYDAKRIRTIGFLGYGFEESSLFLSQADAQHGVYTNSVWIEAEDRRDDLTQLDGRYVLIEGTFNARNRGHGSLSVGAIERVTRVEALPRIDRTEHGEPDRESRHTIACGGIGVP